MKKGLIGLICLALSALAAAAGAAPAYQPPPARVMLSNTVPGLHYDPVTGITSPTTGYAIPTTTALASYLTNTLGTGKGTLVGFSAANTPGTLAAGTDAYVLTADANSTLGFKWALAQTPLVAGVDYQPAPVMQPAVITGGVAAAPVVGTTGASIVYNLAVNAAITSIPAPTGTPTGGQRILMRLQDTGGPFAVAGWNGIYVVIGTVLPVTTVANKDTDVLLIYNVARTRWDVMSVSQE